MLNACLLTHKMLNVSPVMDEMLKACQLTHKMLNVAQWRMKCWKPVYWLAKCWMSVQWQMKCWKPVYWLVKCWMYVQWRMKYCKPVNWLVHCCISVQWQVKCWKPVCESHWEEKLDRHCNCVGKLRVVWSFIHCFPEQVSPPTPLLMFRTWHVTTFSGSPFLLYFSSVIRKSVGRFSCIVYMTEDAIAKI